MKNHVKKVKNALNVDGLMKVADNLFNSKLIYGLQLCGQFRNFSPFYFPSPEITEVKICYRQTDKLFDTM